MVRSVAAALTAGLAAANTKITFREKGSAPPNDCVLYSDFADGKRLLKSTCDVQFHDPSLLTQPSSLKDVREQVSKIGFFLPKPATCPVPTIAADTVVGGKHRGLNAQKLQGAVTGKIAEVSCNDGFKDVEPVELGCYIDGFRAGPFEGNTDGATGDKIYPVCEPITCPLEVVTVTDNKGASVALTFPETENLIINPFGATLTRQCPDTHKGQITRICEEKKDAWTATGTCEEKQCPAVSINIQGTAETVNFAAILQKNAATKGCPTGYSGSIKVDCPAHTEFSSTSHDCVRQCVAFGGPANGSGCPVMADGTSCFQDCNTGYVRNDAAFHASKLSIAQSERICQTDGSWSGLMPTCIRRCDPLTAGVGSQGISASFLGQTATHSCKNGYSGPAQTRTCQADGTWSGATPSCSKICYAVGASNGASAVAQGLQGNTITQSCSATFSGSAVQRTCGANGQWSGNSPSCLKICNAVGNGGRTTGFSAGVHGNQRTHSCATTYTGSASTRTCLASGVWGGNGPSCSKICNSISSTGSVNAVSSGVEGQTKSHSCRGGYSGSTQQRTCQSNGQWSGGNPACARVCNAIGATTGQNGLSSGTAGQGQWHSCKGTHSGSNTYRTCGTNGNWGGNAPSCLRRCNAVGGGTGYNGVSAGVQGDSRSQSCNGGYTGSTVTRTCQSNGAWSGGNPSCQQPSGMIKKNDHMRGFYYQGNWRIEWPNFYASGSRCSSRGTGDEYCSSKCADRCFQLGYRYCTILWRTSYCCNGGQMAVGCLMGNNAGALHHPNHNGYYANDWSDHYERRGRRLVEGEEEIEMETIAAAPMADDGEMNPFDNTGSPDNWDTMGNILSYEDHQKFLSAMEAK